MKQKKCPYAKSCDKENDAIDAIWRFTCPAKLEDCLRYHDKELFNAVPEDK